VCVRQFRREPLEAGERHAVGIFVKPDACLRVSQVAYRVGEHPDRVFPIGEGDGARKPGAVRERAEVDGAEDHQRLAVARQEARSVHVL
jgi:hypothetical protein